MACRISTLVLGQNICAPHKDEQSSETPSDMPYGLMTSIVVEGIACLPHGGAPWHGGRAGSVGIGDDTLGSRMTIPGSMSGFTGTTTMWPQRPASRGFGCLGPRNICSAPEKRLTFARPPSGGANDTSCSANTAADANTTSASQRPMTTRLRQKRRPVSRGASYEGAGLGG